MASGDLEFYHYPEEPETLIVVFSRVVNNLGVSEEKNEGKFFVVALGEFRRTSN
jgi:hypothetical protein